MEILIIIGLIVVGVVAVKVLANQARRKKLTEKYGDEQVVEMIMKRMMWQGMSGRAAD